MRCGFIKKFLLSLIALAASYAYCPVLHAEHPSDSRTASQVREGIIGPTTPLIPQAGFGAPTHFSGDDANPFGEGAMFVDVSLQARNAVMDYLSLQAYLGQLFYSVDCRAITSMRAAFGVVFGPADSLDAGMLRWDDEPHVLYLNWTGSGNGVSSGPNILPHYGMSCPEVASSSFGGWVITHDGKRPLFDVRRFKDPVSGFTNFDMRLAILPMQTNTGVATFTSVIDPSFVPGLGRLYAFGADSNFVLRRRDASGRMISSEGPNNSGASGFLLAKSVVDPATLGLGSDAIEILEALEPRPPRACTVCR